MNQNKISIKGEDVDYQNEMKYSSNGDENIFFRCPYISEEKLTKKEWIQRIKKYMDDNSADIPIVALALVLQNCNPQEKIEPCRKTLLKYLENLIKYPTEVKYKKIRKSNSIFCERIRDVDGAVSVLLKAGFHEIEMDGEEILVLTDDVFEIKEKINTLLDALSCLEPFKLKLDRDARIFTRNENHTELIPIEFFKVSAEELFVEQQKRTEAVKLSQILSTRNFKYKTQNVESTSYCFTFIRIRFPDGFFLQGTFDIFEKLIDVYEFTKNFLKKKEETFLLVCPTGRKFLEEEMQLTLLNLNLVPNAVLLFNYENDSTSQKEFLKHTIIPNN